MLRTKEDFGSLPLEFEAVQMFGIRLRSVMKYDGVSIEKLAEATGKSRELVNKWLLGQREPKLIDLMKIAVSLEVSIDYLLGLTDQGNM